MTLPIARELAQFGIRVNTIAPGLFLTPMLLGLPQEAQEFARPLGARSRRGSATRANTPRSPSIIVENAYLNGETIRIDGALRMAPR